MRQNKNACIGCEHPYTQTAANENIQNQRAPLLLGQSVLGRLGKIEIDNQQQVIRITHTK